MDRRVEDAQERAEEATRQAEISRRRQHDIQETIVKPLKQAAVHNQFADLIRQSLMNHKEA